MSRTIFLLFLVFNFTSYVLAHGGCGPSDQDMTRCELEAGRQDDCSEPNDTHEDHQTESNGDLHLCGCISVFIQANLPDISCLDDLSLFSQQKYKVAKDQFRQRIDRPPIRFG